MMRFSDLLSMSVTNLIRRKLRTFLTVLGVVIGTASIVVMISLGIGLKEFTMEQYSSYGSLTAVQVYNYGGGQQDSGNPDSIHKSVFKTSFGWCSLRCYRMGKLWTTFQPGRKYRFYCHIYPAGRRSVRDCIIFGAGNCEI